MWNSLDPRPSRCDLVVGRQIGFLGGAITGSDVSTWSVNKTSMPPHFVSLETTYPCHNTMLLSLPLEEGEKRNRQL
ncbi:uncharacterized protein CTRU02_206161 [Colletotrichum truncatum]|uniref:Uncharacterized protein n=1 Tax=Colletotrichum truncatum TaxID=5467 RepID=A0ACC3Z620_COLTU|nr:uncharacterized protein CTRU02_10421 [Colletotrichum truncatum]KAF6787158.1 hypothetical protein CTRU02_10421 [Colletotrichum truncatum]